MLHRLFVVLALALGVSSGLAVAEDKKQETAGKAAAMSEPGDPAKASPNGVAPKSKPAGQPKAKKKAKYSGKLTGINTAGKEELMKLPGVTAAVADKIIANRPYLTKVHLVMRNIIAQEIFEKIKDRVVADGKPPF